MSRAVLVLASDEIRRRACDWVRRAEPMSRVEFKGPRRSSDQNAKFWAMLTDVATQLRWHGVALSADDWRLVFLDALKRETRIVPNIDGTGFVQLGRSSSDLSVAEFRDLIEIVSCFGAQHGVVFSDPPIDDPRAPQAARRNALEAC